MPTDDRRDPLATDRPGELDEESVAGPLVLGYAALPPDLLFDTDDVSFTDTVACTT